MGRQGPEKTPNSDTFHAVKTKEHRNFFHHLYPNIYLHISDVLRDLIPLVQFKSVKNTYGGVLFMFF